MVRALTIRPATAARYPIAPIRDPRSAATQAVTHAGPTIAAAGVILAGTFASLMLGGNTLIVSMGFALAVGILIVSFVMSMFFTPALTSLLGHAAWWPGHGDVAKDGDGSGHAGHAGRADTGNADDADDADGVVLTK